MNEDVSNNCAGEQSVMILKENRLVECELYKMDKVDQIKGK